jgi:hypothetical protein
MYYRFYDEKEKFLDAKCVISSHLFICSKIAQLFSFSICFTLSICDEDYTTGGTCETGTTYPSRANKFTPGFKRGWCCSSV